MLDAVTLETELRRDTEKRPGMTECRDERVWLGGALAHLPLRMQGRSSRLVRQVAVAS